MSELGEILDPKLKLIDPRRLASISKVSELLDDTNWTTWKDQIWRVFQFGKIRSIVNGTMPRPDEDTSPDDAETWTENDNYAQVIITQNLSKGQMIHVARLQTSADMWLALQAIHETKGHLSAIAAQCALFGTHAEEGDDIVTHLAMLKGRWETLNMIDAEDFTITDIQFKGIIATSLPASWDSYTEPFVGRCKGEVVTEAKKLMSSQQFIGALIEEYKRRKDRIEGTTTQTLYVKSLPSRQDLPKSNHRSFADRIGEKPNSYNLSESPCTICGLRNHATKDCFHKGKT